MNICSSSMVYPYIHMVMYCMPEGNATKYIELKSIYIRMSHFEPSSSNHSASKYVILIHQKMKSEQDLKGPTSKEYSIYEKFFKKELQI